MGEPEPDPTLSAVEHVVLLKVKEGTPSSAIQHFKNSASSLVSIPGVISSHVSDIFVESWMDNRTQGYSHVLRVLLR